MQWAIRLDHKCDGSMLRADSINGGKEPERYGHVIGHDRTTGKIGQSERAIAPEENLGKSDVVIVLDLNSLNRPSLPRLELTPLP